MTRCCLQLSFTRLALINITTQTLNCTMNRNHLGTEEIDTGCHRPQMFPSKGLVEHFFFKSGEQFYQRLREKEQNRQMETPRGHGMEAGGCLWSYPPNSSPGNSEKGIRVRGNKCLHLGLCSGSFICFWFKFWLWYKSFLMEMPLCDLWCSNVLPTTRTMSAMCPWMVRTKIT